MRRSPKGRQLLAIGPCSFSSGTGRRPLGMGLPGPLSAPPGTPHSGPAACGDHALPPLSRTTLSPTPPHGLTQCSSTQSVPGGSGETRRSQLSLRGSLAALSHPPQLCPLRPASRDHLLSAPCSRLGGVGRWREGCSGETEILALGSTSRGSRCTGVKREGWAGGHYLVPSSGLPSPSVFPSSSVFWSSVFSLCCFFRRTHFTTISTRMTTAKKPPTEAPTMTATVESCFGGSGETGHGLRAHSPHLGQPAGATGKRQGLLPPAGEQALHVQCRVKAGHGADQRASWHPRVPDSRGDHSTAYLW